MGPRLELILAACALSVGACSSASSSSSESPTAAVPPTASRAPSSGSSSGPTSSFQVPTTCPSYRASAEPIAELTDAVIRERVAGIYRSCSSASGLEVRIDPDTDRITWWSLDARFVRDTGSGFIEIADCSGDSCTIVWHSNAGIPSAETGLRLYTDPTALELEEPTASSSSQEWVRVSD